MSPTRGRSLFVGQGKFEIASFRKIRFPDLGLLRSSRRSEASSRSCKPKIATFRQLYISGERWLCLNAERNLVACTDASLPRLVLVSDDGKCGSLVAIDLIPFAIGGLRYRSLSAPVQIFEDGDAISLFLDSERRFLRIDGDHDGAPCCRGDRSREEAASLRALPLLDVSGALQAYAADLRSARNGDFSSRDVGRASFLAALASCAPAADLAILRRLLKMVQGQPRLLEALTQRDPSDFWAANVLGPHLAPERYGSGKVVGSDLDWLGDDYVTESGCIEPKTFGEKLVYAFRDSLPGRDEICIVATARNEGLYIVDWVAYHLSIGIKQIHIYANENEDGSDALLHALDQAGYIRFVRSEVGENRNAQGKAYGHAFRVNPNVIQSRWCLVCDLDEYFVFDKKRFEDASDYVAWATARYTDVLMFRWGYVGPSRHVRWSPDPVIERFRTGPAWADMYAKALFRTGVAAQCYAHFPIGSSDRVLTYRNAVGEIRTSVKGESQHRIWGRQMDDDPVTSMAYLCHYYYKSAEEFVIKHTRNRGDHPKKAHLNELVMPPYHLAQFLKRFDRDEEPWPVGTPRSCAPDVHNLYEMIRSDAAIASAEVRVRDRYLQRRDMVVSEFVNSRAFEELGEDAQTFKRLLAGGS